MKRGTPRPLDRTRSQLVLGIDASWTGVGWAIADELGPLECGGFKLGGKAWRWSALRAQLPNLERAITDWRFDLIEGARPRVAVERPPQAHSIGGRSTVYPLGLLVGALLCWSTDPGLDLAYPWEIPTSDEVSRRTRGKILRHGWRPWWGLHRVRKMRPGAEGAEEEKRRLRKQAAIGLVLDHWPEVYRAAFPGVRPADLLDDWRGLAGDVAEANLIAVGCAQHPALAPTGPVDDDRPNRYTEDDDEDPAHAPNPKPRRRPARKRTA